MAELALAVAVLSALPAAAGPGERPVVVELYTSQGCSSCPPADALLAKLAQQPGVLAMSFPVTYWDMLGWKDTLATDANTERQKAYAHVMGHGAVYTPQMIVDGVSDVVGSREGEVESTIAAHARENATDNADNVAVTLSETPQTLHIAIGGSNARDAGSVATVWLFHLRGAVKVAIGAGENEGRSVTYRNVVGDLRAVGQWNGEPVSIDLPRSAMEGLPHDAIAVVVQHGSYGHVAGAAMLSHPDFYAVQ